MIKGTPAKLVVNDYWRAAIVAGAKHLHLGQEDLADADLKAIRDAGLTLGISTHDDAELETALRAKPDYIALGPIFPTTLKSMRFAPQGIAKITEWKKRIGNIPLVAIGGIKLEQAARDFRRRRRLHRRRQRRHAERRSRRAGARVAADFAGGMRGWPCNLRLSRKADRPGDAGDRACRVRQPARFRDMAEEFMASRALMFLAGIIIMPAGLAIVLTHNVWTADWRVLITIFGWLNVIGGALRLFGPPFLVKTGRAMLKQPHFTLVAAAIWVVLGLLFCLFGYLH